MAPVEQQTTRPLSKISSFIIDNDGFLILNNRPLTSEIQELGNEGIPFDIPQKWTYSTVDSYIMDILSFHDSRLQNQPNSIKSMSDFLTQASYWHITSLVDLKYACSLPIEMVHPLYWLTTTAVDRIVPEEYNQQRLEFKTLLTEEEGSWGMGTFWYCLALTTPSGMCNIFRKQIQPCLIARSTDDDDPNTPDRSLEFMPWYWARNIVSIYRRKEADKRAYDVRLQQEFESSR
ncbi:hypothetical protein BDW75DRAFT_250233 [Aspergillus navahoensis]